MRIQYNQGQFVQNRYNHTNTELNKTLNKLSSGYQINQAADDAAGLTISEKMRGQIRGLEQAAENIQDGISLVNVADAGLGNIQNPYLVRMRELIIQALNDTNTDEDRALIQVEFDHLKKGIDDIANNTEFNTIHPLRQEKQAGYFEIEGAENYALNKYLALNVTPDGSFDLRTNQGYPGSTQDDNAILVYGHGQNTTSPSVLVNGQHSPLKQNILQPTTVVDGVFTTVYGTNDIKITQQVKLVEDQFEFKYKIENTSNTSQNAGFYFHMDTMLGDDDHAPFIVNNNTISTEQKYIATDVPSTFEVFNNTGNPELKVKGTITGSDVLIPPDSLSIGQYLKIQTPSWANTNAAVGDSGYGLQWNERPLAPGESFTVNTFYGLDAPPGITETTWTPSTVDPDHLLLQVGPNEGQHFKVVLTDARINALGLADANISNRQNAELALALVDKAASYVSKERSKYGAYQNALEHIYTNVSNASENLTKAESNLRDADMANEITKLNKDQVLLQSSQSMMTQINQMSQSILEILA